jgi:hypothetical protein
MKIPKNIVEGMVHMLFVNGELEINNSSVFASPNNELSNIKLSISETIIKTIAIIEETVNLIMFDSSTL